MSQALSFREALLPWFDAYGLMNTGPNFGTNSESGNPLCDTGMAYCLLKRLDKITSEDRSRISGTMTIMQYVSGSECLFRHKPNSTDEVTHDDLIGAAAAGAAAGINYAYWIMRFGQGHHWVLSDNGRIYWDAVAKPWHQSFYCITAGRGQTTGYLSMILLFCSVVVDAFTANVSDKRLTWMMKESMGNASWFISLAMLFWGWRIKKRFGGLQGILSQYYGTDHVFTQYCPPDFI